MGTMFQVPEVEKVKVVRAMDRHSTGERLSSHIYNQPVADVSLVGCPHCDLLQRLPDLSPGASARCPRCNKELWRHREDSLNRTFALTVGAALLYVVANSVPMLGLTIVGREASTTVIGSAEHLRQNGQQLVAVLVLLTAVIAPALQIGLMLAIVLIAHREHPSRWVDIRAQIDLKTFEFSVPVTIRLDPQRLGVRVIQGASGADLERMRKKLIDSLVAHGARAQSEAEDEPRGQGITRPSAREQRLGRIAGSP
jgi:Paraquat-inducible protein A